MGRAVLLHPYRDWSTNDHEKTIAERLAAAGYDVARMACAGDLAACDRYWFNAYRRRRSEKDCLECQKYVLRQEAKIPGERLTIGQFLTDQDRAEVTRWAANLQMESWTSATFDGYPVAHWAMSSIATHLREFPVRDDDWTGLSVARDVLHAAATSTRAARRFVERARPEIMIVFNGRHCSTRPFLEITREAGVRVVGHEVGDKSNEDCRFMPGFGIGERGFWDATARAARTRPLSDPESAAVADWIVRRFLDPNIQRYASTDTAEDSPWAEGETRVLVVPSSNDEIMEVDGWTRPEFGAFERFLEWVLACSEADPSAAVVIRAHPNLALDFAWGPSRSAIALYEDLARRAPANVRVIQPGEKASTYSFLRGAGLVVTDFSLMGLEATALGLPALAAGRARYWQAECVAMPPSAARPWREILAEAQERVTPTAIARARRCMWNQFFLGELAVERGEGDPRPQTLADAVDEWIANGTQWWHDYGSRTEDAAPESHEVEDLWDAIARSRGSFRSSKGGEPDPALVRKLKGASRRLRRAASVIVKGT